MWFSSQPCPIGDCMVDWSRDLVQFKTVFLPDGSFIILTKPRHTLFHHTKKVSDSFQAVMVSWSHSEMKEGRGMRKQDKHNEDHYLNFLHLWTAATTVEGVTWTLGQPLLCGLVCGLLIPPMQQPGACQASQPGWLLLWWSKRKHPWVLMYCSFLLESRFHFQPFSWCCSGIPTLSLLKQIKLCGKDLPNVSLCSNTILTHSSCLTFYPQHQVCKTGVKQYREIIQDKIIWWNWWFICHSTWEIVAMVRDVKWTC